MLSMDGAARQEEGFLVCTLLKERAKRGGANIALRTIDAEAAHDASDMLTGLEVARRCLQRLAELAPDAADGKEVKTVAEANRIAIDTIRRIRGLDDAPDGAVVIERSYG